MWRNVGIGILVVATVLLLIALFEYFLYSRWNQDDSICKFIKFGSARQPDLIDSQYWSRTEDELKLLCKLGDDVFIYHIGGVPRTKRSFDETPIVKPQSNVTSFEIKEPSLKISSGEISENLLSTLTFEFEDRLWMFAWEKRTSLLKTWNILAENVDLLEEDQIKLHDRILKTLVKILYAIIMDECYQAMIKGGDIDCSSINLIPQLRISIGKPLLRAYITNGSACIDTQFYIDHFKVKIDGNARKSFEVNLAEIQEGKPAEMILFDIRLCH